jgi:hypothetical protein
MFYDIKDYGRMPKVTNGIDSYNEETLCEEAGHSFVEYEFNYQKKKRNITLTLRCYMNGKVAAPV